MIPLSQIRKAREAVAEACDAALSAKALAAHDKKCHGGHYEGGKCKFRESNGAAEEKPTAAEEYIEAVRKDAKGKTIQQPKLSARAQFAAIVKKYKGTKQWLKAPNGKKSKLTERQWVQVRTQSFKEWFGDWENDPKNASQMLDANGEPAVFWHGSYKNNEFTVFDIKKCAVIRGVKGFYFSPDERRDEVAGQHGEGDERPFFLNLRKPLKCDPDRELTKKDKETYDGVVRINPDDNWEHHFYDYRKGKMRHTVSNKGDIIEAVAFWANQIKSADKNCGDFSTASKDILE